MACPVAVRVALDPVAEITACAGVKLDDWQIEVARSKDDIFCLCSRQTGKSFTACVSVLAHVISNNDSLGIVISPTQRQSSMILRTVRKLLLKLPPAGRPMITKDTVTELRLSNGGSVMALPSGAVSGGTNLRGLSPTLMIIEEAAFLPDSLYFDILRPMIATTRGRVLIITTPNAAQGFAYDLFNGGTMKIIEIKAEDCSRISKAWLEKERKSMPKASYRREYENYWISVNAGIFDVDAIQRAFQEIPDNKMRAFL